MERIVSILNVKFHFVYVNVYANLNYIIKNKLSQRTQKKLNSRSNTKVYLNTYCEGLAMVQIDKRHSYTVLMISSNKFLVYRPITYDKHNKFPFYCQCIVFICKIKIYSIKICTISILSSSCIKS